MIKILHCADLHLDSPFSLDDPKKSEVRRAELRGAFTSMMLYAKTEGVDIMLMAGDLFDREYASRETAALLAHEFASNPGCRFVIAPGNHDPYTPESVYSRYTFPDNVYIFDSDKLSYFAFDDLGTDVYGYAFTAPSMKSNPFAGKHPRNPARLNLLCGHGELGAVSSQYCSIPLSDVRESGFDYIALGHIHNTQGIERSGNTYYGYSGCLEGRDFGETGHKGAVIATLDKPSGGLLRADIRGLRFSKRRYEVERLNVSGCNTESEVTVRLQKLIAEKKFGSDTALRCSLEGDVLPTLELSEKRIERSITGLFFLEVINRTLPMTDAEALKNDPTIKGTVYTLLLPKLREGSPEERECAARALHMVMDALDGRAIGDTDQT
jgi:DNA repair exonuclease